MATLQRCRQPTRFPSVLRLAATEQEVAEAPAAPAAPARVPWWDKGAPPNSRNITGGIQQLVDELVSTASGPGAGVVGLVAARGDSGGALTSRPALSPFVFRRAQQAQASTQAQLRHHSPEVAP